MALPDIRVGDGVIGKAVLASVEVSQEVNQHWWCTVVCRQTEDQRIAIEELLGKQLKISTTDDSGTEHTHFNGFVYNVQFVYEVWGSFTARITGVSFSYMLDVTARKQYYADQTLSSIAGTIGGRDNVPVAVNAGGSKALNYVQYGETDFSFLNRIVDDYGAWLRPSDSGVEVFNSFQGGSSLQWRSEDGLIDFTLSGSLAPPGFSGSHYDHHQMASNTFNQASKPPQWYPSAQRLTSAVQSASQKLPVGFEPQRARAMTLDDYQNQLLAESERSIGGAITGFGQSRNQLLKAGDSVSLDGILDAKGTYGLIKVEHEWTPNGYVNKFACTPWKDYRNPSPPKARTWNGVVPARVVDHNDPKKMGRIKVQFFWQQDGSTHWARATAPHAGPDRGFMFMPEVGDEVTVAFEDGDPERPVILGSMWNGVQQAPRVGFFGAAADIPDNNVKRIVTKAGNRMQMVDTPSKETVVLASPNHSSMLLTEKHDSTGRPLVHIHSDGDIILTAPNGRVHIQSSLFSREIGTPGPKPAAAAAPAPAAAPAAAAAAPEHAGGVAGFLGGLFDSTVKPLAHMVMHPIETAEGIGHAVAHPIQTATGIAHAVGSTTKAALSGDTYAMGTAVGSVGMFFVPGADVAEGAEDAARLGQLGKVGEVADVGTGLEATSAASDVSKGLEATSAASDVGDVSKGLEATSAASDVGDVSKGLETTSGANEFAAVSSAGDVATVSKGVEATSAAGDVGEVTGGLDAASAAGDVGDVGDVSKGLETTAAGGDATAAAGDLTSSAVPALPAPEPQLALPPPGQYGTKFFGQGDVKYYTQANPTIGRAGSPVFYMPTEDAAMVQNTADAARYTGMAPSVEEAYKTGGDVYGLDFPTDGFSSRLPTAADANGWPHFLEGGNTAVALPNNGGYLVNPTRELVMPGGSPVPSGSQLYKLEQDGTRTIMKTY